MAPPRPTQAAQVFAPSGTLRSSSGTMPTDYGFTGQHADGTTRLDYYQARYYDAVAGQFISADPAGDGLNLFAYVKGNPETLTDPTGLWTGGVCVGGSVAIPGLGGWTSECFVVGYDPSAGWSAGVEGTGAGGGASGFGGGVSPIGFQFSTAATVDDLNGPFVYFGGSGSVFDAGLTGSGFVGDGRKSGNIWGFDIGYQPGVGGEVHGGLSYTKVLDLVTVGSKAKHGAHQQIDDVRRSAHGAVGTVDRGLHSWIGDALGGAGPIGVGTWLDQGVDNAAQSANQQIDNASNWTNQQIDNASNTVKWLFSPFGW